jgi:hypothetical protein
MDPYSGATNPGNTFLRNFFGIAFFRNVLDQTLNLEPYFPIFTRWPDR